MIDELQRLPVGFMEQIIEYRRYAEAKTVNDANLPGRDTSEWRMLATEIEHALAKEEIDAT